MAAIREPHAEIEFTTLPSTVVEEIPDLIPCVVARANQIVEIQNSDGTINSEAVTTISAAILFTGTAGVWTAEDGDDLSMRIDNGAVLTATFAASPAAGEFITGDYNRTQLKSVFEQVFTGASCVDVGSTSFILRSDTTGASSKIEVTGQTDGNPTSPMFDEVVAGYYVVGQATYTNDKFVLRDDFLPDPRSLGDDKEVEAATVECYYRRGNTLTEFKRDEAILEGAYMITPGGHDGNTGGGSQVVEVAGLDNRGNKALVAVDDGDGDALTPKVVMEPYQAQVTIDGMSFTALTTGLLTADGDVLGLDTENTIGAVGSELSIEIVDTTGSGPATYTLASNKITIDLVGLSDLSHADAVIGVTALQGGTLVSGEVVTAGNCVVTTERHFAGYDPPDWNSMSAAGCTIYGEEDASTTFTFSTDAVLNMTVEGGRPMVFNFSAGSPTAATVIAAINAQLAVEDNYEAKASSTRWIEGVSTTVLSIEPKGAAYLYGRDSSIELSGTAVPILFGPAASYSKVHFGDPHPVDYGDEVWADGSLIGTVVGFETYTDQTYTEYTRTDAVLVLDTEVSTSFDTTNWYIKAKNLATTLADSARPHAEMYVSTTDGTYTLKDNLVTNYAGTPVTANSTLYTGYTALRKDLSDDIVVYSDPTDIATALAPISPDNPFGLMMYLMCQEANGNTIAGIAINDFSATEPYGTEDAYTEALGILEGKNVHRIVSGTLDQGGNELFDAHAAAMNASAVSRGRLVYVAEELPSEMPPTLIGTGDADSAGGASATITFELSDLVLADAFAAVSLDPDTVDETDGVFVTITANSYKYLVASVDDVANTVTIKTTGFLLGENDDLFYTSEVLPALISATTSLKLRGAALADRDEEIEALGDLAANYTCDDTHFVQPDSCTVTVSGVDYNVDNRYIAACVAGAASKFVASKNLNGMQLQEINSVTGSNDRYSETQLNLAQGEGVFWVENYRGATAVRQQLTVTTERSNMRAARVYLQAYWQRVFKEFLRMEEISVRLEEELAAKIEGASEKLVRDGIVRSFTFSRLEQDPDSEYGIIGYAECELLKPFETMTFKIQLI